MFEISFHVAVRHRSCIVYQNLDMIIVFYVILCILIGQILRKRIILKLYFGCRSIKIWRLKPIMLAMSLEQLCFTFELAHKVLCIL